MWPFVYYFYFEKDFDKFSGFIIENIAGPAVYDPLTFLGLPKAWRGDLWNRIDVWAIVTGIMVLSYGAGLVSDKDRPAYITTVVLAVAGLFIKILGYMKTINLKCRCRMHISTRAGH